MADDNTSIEQPAQVSEKLELPSTVEAKLRLRWTLKGRRYRAEHPQRRRNDLLPAVGFLELSNALDFAANAWNAIPPLTIAMVFMAVGATGALVILALAIPDLPRAWRNARILRQERTNLIQHRQNIDASETDVELSMQDIKAHEDINHRELGNEIIDRVLMTLMLGFGAFTVGVGTYLAIAGAHPAFYLASNIITGYVGNVPAALYGLLNGVWSIYGFRRAQQHSRAADQGLKTTAWADHSKDISARIKRHCRRVQLHAVVNGIAGIVGGAGSLMTASAYIFPVGIYGYVLLGPCVVSDVFVNLFWRHAVNYGRDVVDPVRLDTQDLVDETGLAIMLFDLIQEHLKPHRNQRHVPTERHLHSFLSEYLRRCLELLRYRASNIAKGLEALTADEQKTRCAQKRVRLLKELQELEASLAQSNSTFEKLHPPKEDLQHHPSAANIAFASYQIVLDLGLFADLCSRLVNLDETRTLVIPSNKRPKDIEVYSSLVYERLERQPSLIPAFLNVTRNTLAVEGAKHAKSQVRYRSELIGCYLSFKEAT